MLLLRISYIICVKTWEKLFSGYIFQYYKLGNVCLRHMSCNRDNDHRIQTDLKSVQLNHLPYDESRLKVGASWTGTPGSGTAIGGGQQARVWWPFIPCRVIKWSITIHEGDQPWNTVAPLYRPETLDKGQVALLGRGVNSLNLTYNATSSLLLKHTIERDTHLL